MNRRVGEADLARYVGHDDHPMLCSLNLLDHLVDQSASIRLGTPW